VSGGSKRPDRSRLRQTRPNEEEPEWPAKCV
jgi:hypothetical protein